MAYELLSQDSSDFDLYFIIFNINQGKKNKKIIKKTVMYKVCKTCYVRS